MTQTAPSEHALSPACRALADGLDEWACLLDRQGRILWSSRQSLACIGADPDRLTGMLWVDALALGADAPRDRDGGTLRDAARHAIARGQAWTTEVAPTPDDRPPWARTGESPCQATGFGPCWRLKLMPVEGQGLWGTASDLAARRQLEAEVEDGGRVLEAVRRFGRVGVWRREIPSGRGHWDDTVFRLFGFDPRQGTPDFEEAARRIHPDDDLIDAFQRSTLAVGDYQSRYRVNLPGGSQRVVRSQWTVLPGPDGRPAHTIGVMSDETEVEGLSQSFGVMTEQLRLAVQMSGIGLWVHDLQSDRLHYNDELFRMMGRAPQPQGLSLAEVRELIHPDDRGLVLASAAKALESPEPVAFEARYRAADGSWRHVLSRRVVRRDAQGRPLAFLGVSMDVTEQVAERLRTRDLHTRLEQVVDTAGVGTWRRDLVTDEVEWNQKLYRIYGIDPQQGPLPRAAWLACVHPEDRAATLDAMRRAENEPGVSVESKFRIRWPSGEVRWLDQRSACTVTGGGSRVLSGITLDVTERTRTEAALRSATDRVALAARSAGVGTWSVDYASGEAYWDEQMWQLRGLQPAGPAPDFAQRLALVHPDDRPLFSRATRTADRPVPDGATYEFRVVWPDGRVRWLASRSRDVLDPDGRRVSRVGVNWDVTDRRAAEQVREERENALRASRAKSEFLARMSHELRTPLNAVLGFTQLLRDELAAAPAGQRMKLDHIHGAGEHLLGLINDVLALTHVEAGSLALDIQPVDLEAALGQSLPLVAALAEPRAIRIETGPMGLQVMADPMRLRQVLVNLLSNAIKYNRHGGRVWVDAAAEPAAGQVKLTIRDEGAGIPAAQMPHLFEPFNRLGMQARDVEGTGIGLVIVKALCEAMQGNVEVKSAAAGGTEVVVGLPWTGPAPARAAGTTRHRTEDDSVHRSQPSAAGATAGTGAGAPGGDSASPRRTAPSARTGPGSVLYIEDNPVNVLLVQEMIETQTALKLRVAVTGTDGLMRAHADLPDLVLVDMQLPDMNGHEVLERLRASPRTRGLACVALSANAMREDIDRALAAGFQDYWTKPIDFAAFLQRLRERFPPP